MSLKAKLDGVKKGIVNGFSSHILDLSGKASQNIEQQEILEHALGLGDKAPSFSLPDIDGKKIVSSDLLKNGPLVVCFYRGGWCPYCNLTLMEIKTVIDEVHKLGARLVAISPESRENAAHTAHKHKLPYPVLADKDCKVSRAFKVAYCVPKEMFDVEMAIGVDLHNYNDSNCDLMPAPATYIIDATGTIRFVDVHTNPSQRTEPSLIVKELKKL